MTAPFDTSRPNVARMYDYWLGGRDNFAADRKAADAVRGLRPNIAEQAFDNKKFQTRAVAFVAGQGVRQFLDIGAGLPTSPVAAARAAGKLVPPWLATHEAAATAVADPIVAYVDNDPVAVLHSETLLAGGKPRIVAATGDMRNPAAILRSADIHDAGFDIAAPACVILACVLHFVDAEMARDIVAAFARPLAPGSFLIVSVGYAKGKGGMDFARTYNAQHGPRIYAHSWEQITAFFDGLELMPPGLVDAAEWPEGTRAQRSSMIVAGVARRT